MKDVIANRVLNSDALKNTGDFCWYSSGGEGVCHTVNGQTVPALEIQYAGIGFMCPCGCGQEGCVTVYSKGQQKSWEWNGNPDKLTLLPSIFRRKDKDWPENCGWHGFLTTGVRKTC
jgi:hypothetical protein